jgi:hypothetical protein
MKQSITLVTLFAGLALVLTFGTFDNAHAYSSYLNSFNSTYGTSATVLNTCGLCHIDPAGGGSRNSYGSAYSANGHNFKTIEPLDSDGDGFTNITEINARTFPGDATSHPSTADTTPPTVTTFSLPSTSSSLTVSISALAASDNVGVTGYMVNESSTKPASNAAGWSTTPPSSYTFASAGTKTLYAWAKDAAGNVSASRSASVTITINTPPPPPPPPTMGSLISPATSGLVWDDVNKRMGVGTVLPLSSLHVSDTSSDATRGLMSAQHNDGPQAANVVLRKSRGNESAPTQLLQDDYIGIITAQYWNGTTYDRSAQFGMKTDGPVTAGSAPTAITFFTGASTNSGDPLILAERLRISSNGNVGVGTTTPDQKLEVDGGVRLNTVAAQPACDANVRGTFWVNQGSSSDTVQVCILSGGSYVWRTIAN